MVRGIVPKSTQDWIIQPNLLNYEQARRTITWESAQAALGGFANMTEAAVDRHAMGPLRDKVALRFLGLEQSPHNLRYGELKALTDRFANVLAALGVKAGDRVFALLGRVPELYIAALGSLKHRSIFCPLFSAFGPEPIRARMTIGGARVLITTPSLYRKKIANLRADLSELEFVLLAGDLEMGPGTLALNSLMATVSDDYVIRPTHPEDPALLHFTSGTTGTPKGALHVHQALVAHYATARLALDLHPEDTYWYTAPTAIRMLMKAGTQLARSRTYPRLRFLASVGEPLNPEAVVWGQDAFGLPFHDNWWQTETGGIMVANYAAMDIRPGSMGKPLPGVDVAVVKEGSEGLLVEAASGEEAGVIGKPDPVAFELVKAFVALKDGYRPCEELREELLGFSRKRLGSAVAPKEITFMEKLPRTRSGKILRRLLKARELGLPEGDTSTLEA